MDLYMIYEVSLKRLYGALNRLLDIMVMSFRRPGVYIFFFSSPLFVSLSLVTYRFNFGSKVLVGSY
jgi:hypothetical protein